MRSGTVTPAAMDSGGRRRAGLLSGVLLAAFGVSLALRVAVGGVGVSQSPVAGLVFAGSLLVLTAAAGTAVKMHPGALLTGAAGGVLLCVPTALAQLLAQRPVHDTAGFGAWALVVTVVATAEEVFLRGTLYDAVSDFAGAGSAVVVAAVAFALLHVPLYGWHVVPLDLAVGVVLGGLRASSGTAAAPAVAHVGADLAGWFLR